MQHDELIWSVINPGFCAFKVKTETQNFCKNKYNVTGLCNRSSCPLANSRYATVREEDGVCFLFLKTIERAHTPRDMWEKIMLPRNYEQALKVIDEHLLYWPNFLQHKCKQRLTKIHQYLIRMRKMALNSKEKLVGVYKKVERREKSREQKAEKAARLTNAIEKELLERLQAGMYDEYLPAEQYEKVLDVIAENNADKQDADVEDEEEEEGEEFVEDYEEEGEDVEEIAEKLKEREVEIELELEGNSGRKAKLKIGQQQQLQKKRARNDAEEDDELNGDEEANSFEDEMDEDNGGDDDQLDDQEPEEEEEEEVQNGADAEEENEPPAAVTRSNGRSAAAKERAAPNSLAGSKASVSRSTSSSSSSSSSSSAAAASSSRRKNRRLEVTYDTDE